MLASRLRRPRGWWRSALALAALAYAFVLAATIFTHHDLSCELKSRTHCTACISGVSAPGLPESPEPPARDAQIGVAADALSDRLVHAPGCWRVSDRAPPTA